MTTLFKLRATQMEAKVAKEKERAEKERIMAEEKAAEEGKQQCILPKLFFYLSSYQRRNGRRKNESIEFT